MRISVPYDTEMSRKSANLIKQQWYLIGLHCMFLIITKIELILYAFWLLHFWGNYPFGSFARFFIELFLIDLYFKY